MTSMLWEEIRALDTGVSKLRSFGLLVGGVLVAIALLVFWRHGWSLDAPVRWLGSIGISLAFVGLVLPRALTPIYRVWMALAVVLGFVMTRVILTLVFFLMVTPIGWIMRLFGRDPLNREIDKSAATYWLEREYVDAGSSRLEKYY